MPMKRTCPVCEKSWEMLSQGNARCPQCGWNQAEVLDEGEPRFTVLYAMILRAADIAKSAAPRKSPFVFVEASPREVALVCHGDQIKVDEVFWRVTGVLENGVWLRPVVAKVRGTGRGKWVSKESPWAPRD